MKFRRILPYLAGLSLCLMAGVSQAEDIGKYGPTWNIQEQDAIDMIKDRLTAMEKSGQLQKMQNAYKQKQINYILHPPATPGITTATAHKVWTFDPSYTFDQAVKDSYGNMIVPPGTRINPLAYMTLSESVLFIDGRDPKQLAFAKHDIDMHPRDKVVLTAGSYIQLTKAWNHPVFFDQRGALTSYFGIKRVPSILSQKGNLLQVEELAQ